MRARFDAVGLPAEACWYSSQVAKRVSTVSIDDVISAIETARDKVMADEVKSLVKLGLPKSVAYKMVAERYRQRSETEEGEEAAGGTPWPDMS